MKVFGVGLARTGGLSLATALRSLGYKTVHFPHQDREYLENDAATDSPVALAYRDLDSRFPGAKFVLTIRELPAWLESVRWLFDSSRPLAALPEGERESIALLRQALYGTTSFDAVALTRAYHRHVEGVKGYFAGRQDLLVLNITAGEGWSKLCPFLGKPIPTSPFPRKNGR